MAKAYKFPVPREERIVVMTAVMAAPGIVLVLAMMLANIAETSDYTLRELFDLSRGLRASFAGIVVIYLMGLYASWAFLHVKDNTRLEVGEQIRYVRPGAPLFGWFACDRALVAEQVDRIQVDRVRRGTVERVEVLVGAGREEIAVNLAHSVSESEDVASRPARELPKESWGTHPLVAELETVTGREAQIG